MTAAPGLAGSTKDQQSPPLGTRGAVVVGYDGSATSAAAVSFAVGQAVLDRRPLRLVTALAPIDTFPDYAARLADSRHWVEVREQRSRILQEHPRLEVQIDVRVGDPVGCLVERSSGQSLLVLGRTGVVTTRTWPAGSTALAVAQRSRIPTVVVPAGWDRQPVSGQCAVVVGLDTVEPLRAALRFGFEYARRWAAPLRLVSGVPTDGSAGEPGLPEETARELAFLAEEFPEVSFTVLGLPGPASTVLLVESRLSQLLVLGRHTFGPVSQAILHASEIPVAIVPEW